MTLKSLKPFTSSARGTVLVSRKDLWKGKPHKSLVKGKSSCGGRNNRGRITVRHQGGGHKRSYRSVDFFRENSSSAMIERIEYDPNRTAFIALVRCTQTAQRSYIIAPDGAKRGDLVGCGSDADSGPGWCMKLADVPTGVGVHNVELKPGGGAKIARSGGVCAKVLAKDGIYTLVAMPSGQKRLMLSECRVTIGTVSNLDNKNVKLGKAGRSRWMGIRPSVRGVVMNPVDHPHGGGEGKTSGGRHPVSPWGLPTKGKKTRKANKSSSKYIKR